MLALHPHVTWGTSRAGAVHQLVMEKSRVAPEDPKLQSLNFGLNMSMFPVSEGFRTGCYFTQSTQPTNPELLRMLAVGVMMLAIENWGDSESEQSSCLPPTRRPTCLPSQKKVRGEAGAAT